MLKVKHLILLITLLLYGCESNNNVTMDKNDLIIKEKEETLQIDEKRLLSNIKEISLTPRVSGTEGEIRSNKFLSEALRDYGYNVNVQDFPIYHQDRLSMERNYFELNPQKSKPLSYGKNIIAKHNNFDENKKSVYITAHYDSDPNTIGVIDNATGVSAVLEIARVLKDKDLPFNVQILFFGAEESGIYGSRYFVSNLLQGEKDDILGVINIDMVGEKNAGNIVVQTGQGRNNILSKMIIDKNNLKLLAGGSSDEYPFYRTKIPSITLSNENSKTFDGENQFQKLDIEDLSSLSQLVVDFISNFNLSEYYNTIQNPEYSSIALPSNNQQNISEYRLTSKKEILLDNGYDSAIVYRYKDDHSKEYTLTEYDSRFVSNINYNDFKILDSENDFMYRTNKDSNDGNRNINYKWGYTFGELKSKENLNDSLSFLNKYYINYYQNLFGDVPNESIK